MIVMNRTMTTAYGSFVAHHVYVGLSGTVENLLLESGAASVVAPISSQPNALQTLMNAMSAVQVGSFLAPPSLVIVGSVLAISGTPVLTGAVNTPYAGFSVIGSGGSAPYTYAVSSGALPAGITLDANSGAVSGTPTALGTQAGIVIRVTDALGGTATLAPFAITVSAAAVAPGAVSGVTAGTPTTTTQPLSWTAPGTGTTPITYSVGYRLNSAGGAYTPFQSGISGTSVTVTGLAVNTAYDYQVTPSNSVGNGTPGTLLNASTAAAGVDTRPRFGLGAANAWTASPDALLAGMTALTGSANGGRAGTFNLTTTAGNFGWVAVLASASSSGVHFNDGTGFGGWSGAGLAGNNTGASPDPTTSTTLYTDGTGTQWRLFRQDFLNANPSPAPYTLS